jgi:hypothetical protein
MPFPAAAPYRLDQVTAAPGLMTGLWLVQVLLALALSWAGATARRRWWWGLAAGLLLAVALFFTLASWGTSDVTKLSHYISASPDRLPRSEPLWQLLVPLVRLLPYRMAAVAGLVAAGYGAVALLLAHRWRWEAWGGWWALLVVCSPLLRSFLQNGITRQALAVLLLVPLLFWSLGLVQGQRRLIAACTAVAALAHTTFPISLATALAPALWGPKIGDALAGWAWGRSRSPSGGTGGAQVLRRAGGGLVVVLLLAQVVPTALTKLQLYSQRETFFSSYPILADVLRLQLALAFALGLVIWRRGLDPAALLRCGLSRSLLLYGGLLMLIQVSVRTGWLAPITFRLADMVGLFLLLTFLAWIHHYRAGWAVLPPLVVTLQGWLVHRLLGWPLLQCGLDDDFLCIPDRLPWLIHY